MLLGIAADLSAPPSSPTSFREVVMVAKTVRRYDVIALCAEDWEIMAYRRWFRVYGLFDFVDELVPRHEIREMEIEIEGGRDARLTAFNVEHVLRLL